ncbi:hypothetical protein DMB92_05245 [Campylobacter sp. MIT 99-7217]|uniref:hypothetical protein n=1 Tax=Campylobacter sp. MIT 99-7217 TaxID=535091 RepID=UPI00115BCDE9|nr:hypothetical protein [Campylobacter sp. MIT 99-7217]TQR31794.1 hypothetical protein DMB92_05245 [Campylobacter sp. MIT 99-7217]
MSKSRNLAYIHTTFSYILKQKQRNEVNFIQKVLCNVILPRFDDFSKDYKYFKNLKSYKSFEECLSFIFEIDLKQIENILKKLDEFKNLQNQAPLCLKVELSQFLPL